ncbi:histone deacetylase family protein [Profundibacterium mesophilum]|uniref:Esterase lipase n=1 Tax=Profundibacterium mesophilum KAUST100406-0324 TaxID=1037889 RepID=A0A921TBN2_9RHOB|nr:histone deacetylase family protein [Profundibacterium mesophilum]KAF0675930.1 esterase lipase [Profundibacterium mesophilum KAUST100406-0324]
MTLAVFTDEGGRAHVTPHGHPEQVARLDAVEAALGDMPRRRAPRADDAEVLRCHPARYLQRLREAAPREGTVVLDADTHMSPGTLEAALRGVGGCAAAVDAVLSGEARRGFSGCRPPGHHAEREQAMGFCLFGNVAIAARRALDHHGLERVAIVDFDVHHGNGTQDLLWDEERVLFISSHQMPLYPGSGARSETGAHGQIVNLPLEAGSGGARMRQLYEAEVFPALRRFDPDLILVSAGFDAHADDPLAQLNWQDEDFAWIARKLCALADETCNGRLVSTLEGGYDLAALERCVAAHVAILQEPST